jgi:drug/metabolite transporter (DMT)-like permease
MPLHYQGHYRSVEGMTVVPEDRRSLGTVARTVSASPRLSMASGALSVSASAIFIDLSGTSPGTATFFRCVLALPLLWPLAVGERRREGKLSRRRGLVAAAAGLFFAGDALLWTQAIYEIGAGLSTVLVNAQVIVVPLLARLIDREPVGRAFVVIVPFMAAGILLTGGVLQTGTAGGDPVWGTIHAVLAAVCYSGFLFLLRRGGHTGQVVQSYVAVVASAAVAALIAGALWQGVTIAPRWAALGWLVATAVCGQVCGWLLVALATPQLRSTVGAALLMLTPVGSLVLSALALGEQPTALQLLGCVVVLLSAYVASSSSSPWRRLPLLLARLRRHPRGPAR